MSSLVEHLKGLEADLCATPMRIAAHSDMPFAIFRYDPKEEFVLRKQLRLLSISLEQAAKRKVKFVSLSKLVWKTIDAFGGAETLAQIEAQRGFDAAQLHINQLLTSDDFQPLADSVLAEIDGLSPEKDLVFLIRAGGLAPSIYRSSILLDALHNRTKVPIILFYPGSAEVGTDLRFYDLPYEGNLGVYNYRVRVYGVQA